MNTSLKSEIRTSDWFPQHRPLDYPDSLWEWVNSINRGWREKIYYEPFELYRQQAYQWLEDKDDITSYDDIESAEDYILREYIRCKDNTLYFENKYGFLKEGDVSGGSLKFKAWEAQEVMLFFFDCLYNAIIGKGRQIGFTSTLGLAASKRINFNKSYFAKFITHTKDKGEEIFRDKIRWGFGQIPDYLRQTVYNDSGTTLSLRDKARKGETKGAHSMIDVSTPVVDAINGGSPNLVLIDEIGLMSIFGKMMREGRPALFFFDPASGRMIMRRQLFSWGTGGEMDKGGAIFEIEFKSALKAWREKNFKYGLIPLFFDCYARQGMTDEIYQQEKQYYYSKSGVEGEVAKVQFHQHYPTSIEDMFLRTANTIIPVAECNKYLARIYNLPADEKPQYGFYEPIYDQTKPTPDGVLPYKLIGARFVPTKGVDDPTTTAVVFRHPPHERWEYRFYQGVDPINSETGHSKMSASIWDAYANTISAMIFYREKRFKECYLQCVLQKLYYDYSGIGVPELIESNIGDMYLDFNEQVGYDRSVVSNASLPLYLQGGSSKWWGISNKTNTAGRIANKIIEMVDGYADNIYIMWIFTQLKTFVEKDLKGNQTHRQTRYQAADLRYDFDDGIFSSVFAYINAQAHSRYEPKLVSSQNDNMLTKKYVQNRDTNFKLRLAEVNKDGKIVRYFGQNGY